MEALLHGLLHGLRVALLLSVHHLLRVLLIGHLLSEALLEALLHGLLHKALLEALLHRLTVHAAAHTSSSERGHQLVRLILQVAVLVGVAAVGTGVGQFKLYLVEIGRVHIDMDGELVAVLIASGIIGNRFALRVLPENFGTVLLHIVACARHL